MPKDSLKQLEEFCDNWLKSWTGNKPEQLLEFYTEDVFYSDPAYPEGLHGKKSLSEYLQKLLKKNPNWKWERVILYPTDEGFTLKWRAEVFKNGNSLQIQGMDRIVLRDNKIARNEVYFDPRALMAL